MIIPNHTLSLSHQCRLLDISRSGIYYCPKDYFEDTQIMNCINEIHQQFPYYGYRKIHWCLKNYGYENNIKKTQRLIQEMGIKAIYPGPRTSIPSNEGSVFPYLIKDIIIIRANQVWGVDITYIKLPVGTIYLFALIDWYSRFIVAHKVTNTMEACHGIEIIETAIIIHGIPEICNADQGAQFTGKLWIDKLNEYAIKISHDGVGRYIDNIRIERFWRTIKYEDIFLQDYETIAAAREGINKFIEHYNYRRPHQALNYKTPSQLYFSQQASMGASLPAPSSFAASPG